ncbi:MAG: flagellar basal body P-ring formation chaperone FlgA [Vicinamibacterales bacterium]
MKCWVRSTTWRGNAVALALGWFAIAGGLEASAPAETDVPAMVEAAIVQAVRGRVSADAEVSVTELRVRGDFTDVAAIVATVDPRARLGERMRFQLKASRGRARAPRVGEADGVVRAKVTVSEIVQPVSRGEVIAGSAIRSEHAWADGLPLRQLAAHVIGARTLRALEPGDVVLARDVAAALAVRNGEAVQLRLQAGSLLVVLDGVAAQDAAIGETVRVTNPSSGKSLRARVVAPHVVEVQYAF